MLPELARLARKNNDRLNAKGQKKSKNLIMIIVITRTASAMEMFESRTTTAPAGAGMEAIWKPLNSSLNVPSPSGGKLIGRELEAHGEIKNTMKQRIAGAFDRIEFSEGLTLCTTQRAQSLIEGIQEKHDRKRANKSASAYPRPSPSCSAPGRAPQQRTHNPAQP